MGAMRIPKWVRLLTFSEYQPKKGRWVRSTETRSERTMQQYPPGVGLQRTQTRSLFRWRANGESYSADRDSRGILAITAEWHHWDFEKVPPVWMQSYSKTIIT